MLVVAMATEVAIKNFTIIFLVLSGNKHSVKVSSNSEMGPGQLVWSSQRIGVKAFLTVFAVGKWFHMYFIKMHMNQ